MADESEVPDVGTGDYIYLRLTGERFEAKGMPADAVRELKTLSEALFQLARLEWLNAHPDRSRVPGGFEESFDLRLISIGEGSSTPHLVLQRPKGSSKKDDPEEIYTAMQKAPAALVQALEGVRDNHSIPSVLSRESAALITRIGRSLGDSEAIEIATEDPRVSPAVQPVKLDLQVRNTLRAIEVSLRDQPEPDEIHVEGVVTEFDGTAQTFRLRMATQPAQVRARIAAGDGTVSKKVKEALAEDGVTAPDVRVTGWSISDAAGIVRELRDVVGVEIVRTAPEKRLLERLTALAALEDGWWEETSLRPNEGVVAALRSAVAGLSTLSRIPDVVARADGTLALESEIDGRHLVAVVEQEGSQLYLCADDGITDDPAEFEGPFSSALLRTFFESGRLS